MLEIDWANDNRNEDITLYLVDPEQDPQSRLKAFLKGWARYLNDNAPDEISAVSWEGLGMLYASSLGPVEENIKKGIYRVLLSQYLSSKRMTGVSADEKQEALSLLEE